MSGRFVSRYFVLIGILSLLAACGGGSSGESGGGSGGSDTEADYAVNVVVVGAGQADPVQQQVAEGEQASVELSPDAGFRIGAASGCGGTLNGSRYTTAAVTAACTIDVVFEPAGSVSGQLLPAPGTAVDVSINDTQAATKDNGECATAQALDHRATVHGFATATATGGDPQQERFAATANPSDFYRVSLSAGDVVELEAASAEGEVDFELYLWNSNCTQTRDSSTDGGDIQRVSSLLGGESVVEVRAQSGASKYVLRSAAAWGSQADAQELADLSSDLPPFVPYEIILTLEPSADSQAYTELASALNAAEGLNLAFKHQETGRATLAMANSTAGLTHLAAQVPDVLAQLKLLDPAAYDTMNTLRIIEFLSQRPQVKFAEPNYLVAPLRTPNDNGYGDQWHYEQIQLPEAWDITTGAREDGQDVVVAVVDTGVYLAHEELQSKLLPGYDFHDGDADPDDYNSTSEGSWHGTHVAGTIAAASNNSAGVASVSWAAKIIPLRVLGEESGRRYDAMQGVRYAAGLANDSGTVPERPADVINMSLGGSGHSSTEQNLYHEVRAAGTIVVAAAGNDTTDVPMYPAAYDGVISVSATDCGNERASYSNFGQSISLAAPGGDSDSCGLLAASGEVLSTVGSGSERSRTSGYGWLMGTSMASPHVAGVAALMRAVYPGLTPDDFDALLASGQLTDDIGDSGRDNDFGYGIINALKAVQAAQQLEQEQTEPSARVVAEPSVLDMGYASEAALVLSQQGEGQAPAVVAYEGQAEWLEVAPDATDSQGLGSYQVLVSRDAFGEGEEGSYDSEVIFTLEDDSQVRVPVYITVGYASEAAPIYVFLLDSTTSEPLYETLATWDAAGELRYSIAGVAPGHYKVMAGSDVDADQLVCQPGEMCGAYPSLHEGESASVADEPLEAVDFSIDILSQSHPFDGEAIPRAAP